MRTLLMVLIGASAGVGICAVACFLRRRAALGTACAGAIIGSLALGCYAATTSDPPSWLPLWGWLAGLFLGAVPGLVLQYATKKFPTRKHRRSHLFLIAGAIGAVLSLDTGFGAEEHFAGKYAYEATPLWLEFEVVRNGDGFTAHAPDGSKIVDLKAANGALVSQEKSGEDFSLQYDRAEETYVLSGKTQVSTWKGNGEVRVRRAVKKLMPMPGPELEARLGVTAAALVQQVRQSERWMHEFMTLRFSAKIAWIRTPAGIEYRKREINAQYPDADLSLELFWGLASREEGHKEVCIDGRRFRVSENLRDKSDQVLTWDGQAFVAYTKSHGRPQGEYLVDPKLGDHGKTVLADLAWCRSQRHEFWWEGEVQDKAAVHDWFGRAEGFVLTGTEEYRGTRCYVLECRPKPYIPVHRWFVGVDDGRLRGQLTFEEGELATEKWMDRYQEVKPGWWFPAVQGFHLIHNSGEVGIVDAATNFVAARYDLRVQSMAVDQPLPNDPFHVQFQEGAKVHDLRFGGMVTYRYKPDMSAKEWDAIREEAVRRAESDAATRGALNALIGQEAPEFPASCRWLNSKPLNWSDLRGKAVVLQFWSRQCGPCHEFIRLLKAADAKSDLVVIGVHLPDDDTEAVQRLMAKYEADGMVCVDASPDRPGQGFGQLGQWFRIQSIPLWFVIGPDGQVAGHSRRSDDAIQMARKTLLPDHQ